MKIGYIKLNNDAVYFSGSMKSLRGAGVEIENIIMGGDDFTEFLGKLNPGDELVIVALIEVVTTMKEVFDFIDFIYDRGAILTSLTDKWIIRRSKQDDFAETIKEISTLSTSLLSRRTKVGLEKARLNNIKLGRRPKKK